MLVILSGVSGAGKDTIKKELLKRIPNAVTLPSFTSRDMRPGEVEGDHYHFISKEEFEDMIANNKLLEYAQYVDNYYGTPLEFVKKNLKKKSVKETSMNMICTMETIMEHQENL